MAVDKETSAHALVDKETSESKFLKALGYGKQEGVWITQYDCFPYRDGFRSDYKLVGREPCRNPLGGRHKNYMKCGNVEGHQAIGGRDFYHNNVINCQRYQCHLCWKYGWCVFRANSIESRFITAEKVLGLPVGEVEHISTSLPKNLYDLPPNLMIKWSIDACRRSGIIGGVNILHPFRKDLKKRQLYKSFHYHVLGYVKGGYDRCRSCIKVGSCWSCDGFEGVTRRAHQADGWIVSLAKNQDGVVEKRESLFGSAWYQLEHSGYKVGVRNFQIVTWWGVVAKNRFKTEKRRVPLECPVCTDALKASWLPDGVEVVANRGEKGFLKNFTLPHFDDWEVIRHD